MFCPSLRRVFSSHSDSYIQQPWQRSIRQYGIQTPDGSFCPIDTSCTGIMEIIKHLRGIRKILSHCLRAVQRLVQSASQLDHIGVRPPLLIMIRREYPRQSVAKNYTSRKRAVNKDRRLKRWTPYTLRSTVHTIGASFGGRKIRDTLGHMVFPKKNHLIENVHRLECKER